jgi:hypothetical protein
MLVFCPDQCRQNDVGEGCTPAAGSFVQPPPPALESNERDLSVRHSVNDAVHV